MNGSSLRELYLTRLREFYRQPARIFWVYAFPIVLAIVLSVAFANRPAETISVTLADDPGADAVAAALARTEVRDGRPGRPGILFDRDSPEAARWRLKTGKTLLVVEPSADGSVRYRYDRTRPEAVAARAAVDDALQRSAGRVDPVAAADDPVTEKGSRYIDFLIPGLIGLNAMGGGLWGIGFLIVNMRLAKLLKRFAATPMPRANFLLALLGARMTFLVVDVVILLGLGVFGFGMPVRGSWLLIAASVALGALAFAGIGLLVGSRVQSTESASGLMNLVMMPQWLLSGVFFDSSRYPAAMQPLVQALPLTHLTESLRGVILFGYGLGQIWPSLLVLAAWAVVTFLLALRLFRWT
jgi:ABC transporter DrrB family efflux protein